MTIYTILVLLLLIALAFWFNALYFKRVRKNPQAKLLTSVPAEEFSQELSEASNYQWKESINKQPISPFLPEQYAEDRLVLMARDPHWIFAYWEIAHTHEKELENHYGEDWKTAQRLLRVYEVAGDKFFGDNFHNFFDIELSPHAQMWHINVPNPGASYYIELGMRLANQVFVPILRSDTIATPRSSISPLLDPNWLPTDVYKYLGNISYGTSSDLFMNPRKD